jgi:Family of unknown function (DUF6263)
MYLKKLITCSLLMLTFGSYAQTLKLALVKGQKYEVTTKSTLNSSASVMGQEMESNTDNTTVQIIEVKDARANETDLVSTTTKLLANIQMMGQETNYDSEKKDNTGPMAEAMDKMVSKIKNMTIDASGKVIKEDKDETEDAMSSLFPGTNMVKQALIGKELKPGMSWPDSVSENTDKMKATTVGTYTINAVNKETHTAVIFFTGTQTSSGTIEQMGMEMTVTSTSKIDSQFEVDINTGVLSQSNSTINGTSNIDAGGMVIPATSKSSTVTKIKKL